MKIRVEGKTVEGIAGETSGELTITILGELGNTTEELAQAYTEVLDKINEKRSKK